MEFEKMIQIAMDIKSAYAKHNRDVGQSQWNGAAYLQGLMGDVGDLAKLVMAKENLRIADDTDDKLAHELSDCLWAIMAIASEFKIDLGQAFVENMNELKTRIDHQ